MKLVNGELAVTARLDRPTDNGFLLLAAEIGRWAGPLTLPSRTRRRVIARLAELAQALTRRDDVTEVVVFRGALRPPGEGSDLLEQVGVRPARYDVVVLVRTTSTDAVEDRALLARSASSRCLAAY
ncbi:hypothetical protein ACWDTP_27000, partial [Mycobacterium sp. NPDC003449]